MDKDAKACMKIQAKDVDGSFGCLEGYFLGKFEKQCRSAISISKVEDIRQENANWIVNAEFAKELRAYKDEYELLFIPPPGAGDDKWEKEIIPKVRDFVSDGPDQLSRLSKLLDIGTLNNAYCDWAVLSMKYGAAKKILALQPKH